MKLTELYPNDLTSEGGKKDDPNNLGPTINDYMTVDSIKTWIRKSGVGLNLAIIKTNKYANAFIEGNTMYVSEEHLADGTWVKQVAHEVSHFT